MIERQIDTPSPNRRASSCRKLAEQFDVHPNQITSWKAQLEEGAADVFGSGGGNGGAQPAVDVKSLRTPTIRRLTPSCRLQLSPIARRPYENAGPGAAGMRISAKLPYVDWSGCAGSTERSRKGG
jgi:transposase-like protein